MEELEHPHPKPPARQQPRNKSRNHNPVGAIGGPLLPFVKSLKNKLFFFAYYEAQPAPSTSTFTQDVLTTAAQQGNYTYLGTDGVKRTVNLLQVAGAAGHTIINLAAPETGQFLLIRQTGVNDTGTEWWSISELLVACTAN